MNSTRGAKDDDDTSRSDEDAAGHPGDSQKPGSPAPEDGSRLWRAWLRPGEEGEFALSADDLQRFRKQAGEVENANPEVLEELSAALKLAQRIRSREVEIRDATERLSFVFDCLVRSTPLLVLARDARLQLQIDVYKKSGLVSRILAGISDGSSVGLVLSALVSSLVVWTGIAIAIDFLVSQIALARDIFFMDGRPLAVISSAAFVGGVVSIATRLREFSRVRDLDPFAMFWTAMLKPLIGVILSCFAFATIAGDVVSFPILGMSPSGSPGLGSLQSLYVLWMIGFLAGFSERFAWDFVDRAQGSVHTAPLEAPRGRKGNGVQPDAT